MQKTGAKEILDKAWVGVKDDLLRIVQEIKTWPF